MKSTLLAGFALIVALVLAACGTTPSPVESTTPTTVQPPGGEVTVTLADSTLEFTATRCLVTTDVFVVDGLSADGAATVAIRHASPPTKAVPEPSMSYLLIEPEPAFESAPAAVNFDSYDPGTGAATGSVDQGVTFRVRCER